MLNMLLIQYLQDQNAETLTYFVESKVNLSTAHYCITNIIFLTEGNK